MYYTLHREEEEKKGCLNERDAAIDGVDRLFLSVSIMLLNQRKVCEQAHSNFILCAQKDVSGRAYVPFSSNISKCFWSEKKRSAGEELKC